MKAVTALILLSFAQASILQSRPKRKAASRALGSNEESIGELYLSNIQKTQSNFNEVLRHSDRSQELKQINSWFGMLGRKIDDYRDSIARKVLEVKMSLQKPIIPLMGPSPMLQHPFQKNASGVDFSMANVSKSRASTFNSPSQELARSQVQPGSQMSQKPPK